MRIRLPCAVRLLGLIIVLTAAGLGPAVTTPIPVYRLEAGSISVSLASSPLLAEVPMSIRAAGQVVGEVDSVPRIVYRDSQGRSSEAKPIKHWVWNSRKAIESLTRYSGENGSLWHVRSVYKLEDDSTLLVQRSVWSNAAQELVRFEGVIVRAGAGSFGSRKDEALFPGLEYLLGDEESSSTLDVTSRAHVRLAPHPSKVTVPLMSIVCGGRMIALMWNPLQKWDRAHTRPRPLFSSPNQLEKKQNHLMGLFLPSMEYGREDELDAAEPYKMQPGKGLTLTARIVARRAEHCVDAVDDWIEHYGFPKPLDAPRTWKDELALCLQPYLGSLWFEKGSDFGWYSNYGRGRANRADICAYLRTATDLLPAMDLTRAVGERAAFVADRLHGVENSLKFAYRFGRVQQGLSEARNWAQGTISAQKPDGSWRFYAAKDDRVAGLPRSKLGRQGETASGIVATSTYPLLKYARISGDQDALEAGLKALEFLDSFVRPQAAQVWEVPVHAPDILASAKCAQAYLEAFRITGEKRCLRKSVYWARTGLPFVYFWQAPEREIMKFGSIPIFGSSIFIVPWFGKPVQWNGAAYAQALFDLARWDTSFDWRAIATGLTSNCAQQQFAEGDLIGLYPDWTSALTGGSGSPWLSPNPFLFEDVFRILGAEPDVDTAVVRSGPGRVHVSGPARVSASLDESAKTLTVRVGRSLGSRCSALSVAGLGEPVGVTWNGADLAEDPAGGPGTWTCCEGVLVVTAPDAGQGRALITYDSLDFSLPAQVHSPALGITIEGPETVPAGSSAPCRVVLTNRSSLSITKLRLTVGKFADRAAAEGDGRDLEDLPPRASRELPMTLDPRPEDAGRYFWVTVDAQYNIGGQAESASGALAAWGSRPVEASLQINDVLASESGTALDAEIRLANVTETPSAGSLKLDPPRGWKVKPEEPSHFNLEPGGSELEAFELSAPAGGRPGRYEAALRISTAGGNLPVEPIEVELPIPCPRRKASVRLDGKLDDWAGAVWLPIADKVTHKNESLPAPESDRDLSARVSAAWDDQYLYLAFEVNDDFQRAAAPGPDIWNSDSIQIGLDGMCERSVDGWDANDHEYGAALTTAGPRVWCWIAPEGEQTGEKESIRCGIARSEAGIGYEIAIPWADVGRRGPKVGDPIGISLLANDVDQDGLRTALELGGGVGLRKDPSKFVMLRLGS